MPKKIKMVKKPLKTANDVREYVAAYLTAKKYKGDVTMTDAELVWFLCMHYAAFLAEACSWKDLAQIVKEGLPALTLQTADEYIGTWFQGDDFGFDDMTEAQQQECLQENLYDSLDEFINGHYGLRS